MIKNELDEEENHATTIANITWDLILSIPSKDHQLIAMCIHFVNWMMKNVPVGEYQEFLNKVHECIKSSAEEMSDPIRRD
jgi:hypothetical protein